MNHVLHTAGSHDEHILSRLVENAKQELEPDIERMTKEVADLVVPEKTEAQHRVFVATQETNKTKMEELELAIKGNSTRLDTFWRESQGNHDRQAVKMREMTTDLATLQRLVEDLSHRRHPSVASGRAPSSSGDGAIAGSVQLAASEHRIKRLEDRLALLEGRFDSLHATLEDHIRLSEPKIRQNETTLSSLSPAVADLDLRVNMCEICSYDGTLVWKVTQWERRRREAKSRKAVSVYSQPFYTSPRGYKCCARLYPNGDGQGQDTHASLFFVIMQNDYDGIMTWPFSHKVTFTIINQDIPGSRQISETFRPDTRSSSFQRPISAMNVASGCPKFALLKTLDDPRKGFVKDDCLFIQVTVDTSTIRTIF